jgi:hypothetical protein
MDFGGQVGFWGFRMLQSENTTSNIRDSPGSHRTTGSLRKPPWCSDALKFTSAGSNQKYFFLSFLLYLCLNPFLCQNDADFSCEEILDQSFQVG